MKTRIAVGAGLLLTLGSAVAGSLFYGQARSEATTPTIAPMTQEQITPEVIAMWKATATTTDYVAPRVPI